MTRAETAIQLAKLAFAVVFTVIGMSLIYKIDELCSLFAATAG